MRKKGFLTIISALMLIISIMQLHGQVAPSAKVEFLNTPVLYKEGGKSFQQVVVSYNSANAGKIVITGVGKELLKGDLIRGNNRFLLTIPAVTNSDPHVPCWRQ